MSVFIIILGIKICQFLNCYAFLFFHNWGFKILGSPFFSRSPPLWFLWDRVSCNSDWPLFSWGWLWWTLDLFTGIAMPVRIKVFIVFFIYKIIKPILISHHYFLNYYRHHCWVRCFMFAYFFMSPFFFLIITTITIGNVPSPNAPLKRVLAYTGCFSRMQTIKEIHEYLSQRLRIKEEDMRLWLYNSEVRSISRVMKSLLLNHAWRLKNLGFKIKE